MSIKKITSFQNPLLKELFQLKTLKKLRDKQQTCILFSKKLINDLLPHIDVQIALSCHEEHLKRFSHSVLISPLMWEKFTRAPANKDALCVSVKMPKMQWPKTCKSVLVLDTIQDPGNMGNLIRTAAALNFDAIYAIDSCDIFNDKTLKASRGANFILPTIVGTWPSLFEILEAEEIPLFVADLKGNIAKKQSVFALCVCNEGKGPSLAVKNEKRITIPIHNVESLNVAVAGGILMAKLKGI